MASMVTFFEAMFTLPVAFMLLPFFSEHIASRSIFSALTMNSLFSIRPPLSSVIETLTLGARTRRPASVLVCRLPSASAVSTLMLSAVICIEAPVVLFLKSSPSTMVFFSASRAVFILLASASSEIIFTYVIVE